MGRKKKVIIEQQIEQPIEVAINKESEVNNSEVINTLLKHKSIFDLYVKTGEIVNLHPHIRDEIVKAYKTEFPHYSYNSNCYA